MGCFEVSLTSKIVLDYPWVSILHVFFVFFFYERGWKSQICHSELENVKSACWPIKLRCNILLWKDTTKTTFQQKNQGDISTLDAQNNSFSLHFMDQKPFFETVLCSFHYRFCFLAFRGQTVATETNGASVQQSDVTGKQQSLVWTPAIHWHTDESPTHSQNLSI